MSRQPLLQRAGGATLRQAGLDAQARRAFAGALLLGPLILGPRGVIATVVEDATEQELVGTAALAALLAGRPEH